MISIAEQKHAVARRYFRDLARLRGHESGAKPVAQAVAWIVSCVVEASILYAVAKVLFFHNLPVW